MSAVDVVVIDDNESVRWLFQEILSLESIAHRITGSGPEGIQLVAELNPRLAIIDLKLGAMNGLEVARRIRATSENTKILFVTGYDNLLEDKVDEELPVVAIIEKPFDVPSLLKLVKTVLAREQ
jgi:CheY-like chemotaxis protein